MKSMKAKAKAKKHNGKFGRVKFPSKEVIPINQDLSQLRQPIDTSVSSLYRVSKVLENGSDEVRSILAYECDLVYECRICRSLFRSLVNFISHKRMYCKEKYDVTFSRNSSNNYDTTFPNKSSMQKPEKIVQESCGNDRILRSQVSKEEQRKDLTSVINMLQKKQTESLYTNTEQPSLETMQSNSSAVYQTVESVVSTQSCTDLMKTQVMELKDMISGQTAVLGPDGQVLQTSHAWKSKNYSNEEIGHACETELICSTCGAKFSTKKTLAVHTRTLHTSHRLCYPCPCCSNTFANTWSVYRHLFKVHRKSNEQVRKLRSQIQEKAFIKDTTVAEDLQKQYANKSLMSGVLGVNETQEWMDHLESDTELQRCGGCGKRFDRKAALSAHSQYCHRRVAAYENTTKIKKTNKVFPDRVLNETIVTSDPLDISNSNETSIRVETVTCLSKADWDMLENEESISQNGTNENVIVFTNGKKEEAIKHNLFSASDVSDPLEIVYTSVNKHKTNVGSKKRKNKDSAKRLINNIGNNTRSISPKVNVEEEIETEKVDHVLVMETKVASIVNFQKLQCLLCKRKFTSVTNLRRHAAIHIGWNRYQCKLCDFKCFVKCDCVAHCNKVHNAQNNRITIEEMITQISDDQYTCKQDIALNITNLEEEFLTPEVVEINISPRHIDQEVLMQEKTVGEIEAAVVNETETEAEVVEKNLSVFQEVVYVNEETQETCNGIKGQNTPELDPELRKMVMEVIFGSSEVNSTKQVEVEETTFPEKSSSKLQNNENIETQPRGSDLKECDIVSLQDNSKPQRPIRNKIKPMNKDFIYDLKEVAFRKDALIVKPFNKPFVKKSLIQEEHNLEKDIEQSSKRFKSLQNDGMSILCQNSVIDKCDIKFDREGLKTNFTFSQCHS